MKKVNTSPSGIFLLFTLGALLCYTTAARPSTIINIRTSSPSRLTLTDPFMTFIVPSHQRRHYSKTTTRMAMDSPSIEEEEEERPKAKKPLAIAAVAKQLNRMKEPSPLQTTILLARLIKNAFTQTNIENYGLLLGDFGILCSTRLIEDMILMPSPYLDLEYTHQMEAYYTGLSSSLVHTSTTGWMHAYSTLADGMQMSLAWLLAVVLSRGYPVSKEATTTDQTKSFQTCLHAFAVGAMFRVAMTSLQSVLMDQELDLLLVVMDLLCMMTSLVLWRAIYTQFNHLPYINDDK